MKQLDFFYQEAQIHFLVHGTKKGMMINATEMAKSFGKNVPDFLKKDHAKKYISALKSRTNVPLLDSEILDFRGRNGMYFCEELALKFAAWLSPEFEVWVYSTIKEITFGRYRKHAQAEEMEQEADRVMEAAKAKLLTAPDIDTALDYFEAEKRKKTAKNLKARVLRNQLDLFDQSIS